jgi:hypothetical protein
LAFNNCLFESVFEGCRLGLDNENARADVRIANNLFKNLGSRALTVTGHPWNQNRLSFINNTVFNASGGVRTTTGDVVIRNNLFLDTTNAVMRLGGNATNNLNVRYNGFYGNSIADVCLQFSRGTNISDIGTYGGPEACGWLTHRFAPVITEQLADQSSCIGGSAAFAVRVVGSEPLSYRWYFDGATPLAGETNAQLNLVNLQTNQAGLYSVAVSNAFGSVTSAPAQLLLFDACVGIHQYAGLSITGMVGRTYNVEYVKNLAETNWTVAASNTFSQPQWLFIDTNTPFDSRKFFRVRLVP